MISSRLQIAARSRLPHALALSCLLMASLLTTPVAGQVRIPLQVGDIARITTLETPHSCVGMILRVESDSVIVIQTRGDGLDRGATRTERIHVSSVTGLERGYSRTNTWRGAGYGALAGLVVGGAFGSASKDPCDSADGPCFSLHDRTLNVIGGGALGLVAGAIVGAVIGRRTITRRWEPVELQFSVARDTNDESSGGIVFRLQGSARR
jgi:hypothetical protein